MNRETPTMPKLTANVPANHLPPELSRQFPGGRPIPGTRYRVTVEEMDEAEKLATLRADLQAARDEMRAGLGIDAADVFAELRAEDEAESRQDNHD